MLIAKKRRMPSGLVAYGVREAQKKLKVSSLLEELYYSWGYERVIPPSITYGSDIATERIETDESLRLINRMGEDLRLRSDITIAVTQSVANRYRHEDFPLRFFYIENVFQDIAPGHGQMREKTQAGLELYGGHRNSQIEIIYLALFTMASLFRDNYRLTLSHVSLLRPIIQQVADKSEYNFGDIKRLFLARDWVTLKQILDQIGCSVKESILELCTLFGREEALDKGERLLRRMEGSLDVADSLEALSLLRKFWHKVGEAAGGADALFLDFGIYKNQNYYSGLLMEGFVEGIGKEILSGGCYDKLTQQFCDNPFSAIGFALELDALLPQIDQGVLAQPKGKSKGLVVYFGDDFFWLNDLRQKGYRIWIVDQGQKGAVGQVSYWVQDFGDRVQVTPGEGGPPQTLGKTAFLQKL